MEWCNDRALQDRHSSGNNRVLAAIPGNAQPSSLSSRQYLGKQDQDAAGPSYPSVWTAKSQYPTPQATLRSNDRQVLLRRKLNLRRLKKRLHLAQAYLQHPKFHIYRTRARRDVDKTTGDIIWNEETETAFQNAIINIPAMGRKKKSQHGRTLGRNELIAEWILQETSQERCRKQISSHLQTLDNIFKEKEEEDFLGVPEWRMINKTVDESIVDVDGPDFYDNSIADMVQGWKVLQAELLRSDCDMDKLLSNRSPKSKQEFNQMIFISKLSFEMWVSLPDKMEETLHQYTSLQSGLTAAAPESLENISDWRTSWPEAVTLVENLQPCEKFTIAQLEVGFKLMSDFPPPGSKLGINLELNFASSGIDECVATGLATWNCTTTIYQGGRLVNKSSHANCHSPSLGVVKPPFESKWWAEQFTRLTEKRQKALNEGDDVAVVAADEFIHDYLANLKIVQVISMSQDPPKAARGNWGTPTLRERRLAVILWSFTQVAASNLATTSWRTLVPPPQRSMINSPLPLEEDAQLHTLPLVSMETAFDDDSLDGPNGFIGSSFGVADTFVSSLGDDLYRDGGLMIGQVNDVSSAPTPHTGLANFAQEKFDNQSRHEFEFRSQGEHEHPPPYVDYLTEYHFPTGSNNMFEFQEQRVRCAQQPVPMLSSQHDAYQRQYQRANKTREAEFHYRKQALLSVTNTHKVLQAQLEGPQANHNIIGVAARRETGSAPPPQRHQQQRQSIVPKLDATADTEDEILRHALISAVNPVARFEPPNPTNPGELLESDCYADRQSTHTDCNNSSIPELIAPLAVRPPIQHYHTFTGVLPHISATAGDDFTQLLESFDHTEDGLLGFNQNGSPGSTNPNVGHSGIVGYSVARPHSQPPPLPSSCRDSPVAALSGLEREQQKGGIEAENDN